MDATLLLLVRKKSLCLQPLAEGTGERWFLHLFFKPHKAGSRAEVPQAPSPSPRSWSADSWARHVAQGAEQLLVQVNTACWRSRAARLVLQSSRGRAGMGFCPVSCILMPKILQLAKGCLQCSALSINLGLSFFFYFFFPSVFVLASTLVSWFCRRGQSSGAAPARVGPVSPGALGSGPATGRSAPASARKTCWVFHQASVVTVRTKFACRLNSWLFWDS